MDGATQCRSKTLEGVIAQLVEQRTENPCVPGSIPGDTTELKEKPLKIRGLIFYSSKFVRNMSENFILCSILF